MFVSRLSGDIGSFDTSLSSTLPVSLSFLLPLVNFYNEPGFGFSTEQEGELAALVYFFFDSATQGPFQEDILRMRDLVLRIEAFASSCYLSTFLVLVRTF